MNWQDIPPSAIVCQLHRCYWEDPDHQPSDLCRCRRKIDMDQDRLYQVAKLPKPLKGQVRA